MGSGKRKPMAGIITVGLVPAVLGAMAAPAFADAPDPNPVTVEENWTPCYVLEANELPCHLETHGSAYGATDQVREEALRTGFYQICLDSLFIHSKPSAPYLGVTDPRVEVWSGGRNSLGEPYYYALVTGSDILLSGSRNGMLEQYKIRLSIKKHDDDHVLEITPFVMRALEVEHDYWAQLPNDKDFVAPVATETQARLQDRVIAEIAWCSTFGVARNLPQ